MNAFDTSSASMHSYLGGLEDLASTESLEVGAKYPLPLVPLRGVVLFPGSTLPVMEDDELPHLGLRKQFERAMLAPAPLSRLIAVVSMRGNISLGNSYFGRYLVGCTAEIRQSGTNTGAGVQLRMAGNVALIDLSQPQPMATILPDGDVPPLPAIIHQGFTSIHPKAAHPWDVLRMCCTAQQLCTKLFPRLQPGSNAAVRQHSQGLAQSPSEGEALQGSTTHSVSLPQQPLRLSYWLAGNLPLASKHRQTLLEAPTALHRLRQEVDMLVLYEKDMRVLRCKGCAAAIVNAGDVLQTMDEGAGSAFCNAYGHVHDLATFLALCEDAEVRMHGQPDATHSWYPGYAWTIMSCAHCMNHLGWRFTPALPSILQQGMPSVFFGIRRDALAEAAVMAPQARNSSTSTSLLQHTGTLIRLGDEPSALVSGDSVSEYESADGSSTDGHSEEEAAGLLHELGAQSESDMADMGIMGTGTSGSEARMGSSGLDGAGSTERAG